MAHFGDDVEFSAFVRRNSRDLLRTAWLLTGDFAAAEDLVQAALAHTWPRWRRLHAPEAYVRRVMVRTFLKSRARRWTGERPAAVLPETVAPDDTEAVAARQVVRDAVRALPPEQRAVVVLRWFDDQTEVTTAHLLGCSVGTVKSQAARALRTLRATPGLTEAISGESV